MKLNIESQPVRSPRGVRLVDVPKWKAELALAEGLKVLSIDIAPLVRCINQKWGAA